ncbi:MAG: NUDIX hydrolase [Clostridiales Family XIII bacterium]|nr:NUDIX hydrolase [Clostridiales Family XIII bacterium]
MNTNTVEEKTLESEMIYEGAILNLRRDKVVVKNGGTSHREIVEHIDGVTILGVTPEGKIPMVRQFRKAAERVMFELPAGKLEKGEDPLSAAFREFREETGYTAGNIERVCSFYPTVGYSTELLHVYIATDLTAGETDFDDNEAIDVEEYFPDELQRMVDRKEIDDSKTLIGFLIYQSRHR